MGAEYRARRCASSCFRPDMRRLSTPPGQMDDRVAESWHLEKHIVAIAASRQCPYCLGGRDGGARSHARAPFQELLSALGIRSPTKARESHSSCSRGRPGSVSEDKPVERGAAHPQGSELHEGPQRIPDLQRVHREQVVVAPIFDRNQARLRKSGREPPAHLERYDLVLRAM